MLKVTNLSCQRGYNQLFSNLNFNVNTGDILRITGANGSGKTSLLKILAGLNAPEEGETTFNNHSVKSDEYQNEVFYLGHLSAISAELTCIENLEFLTGLNKSIDQHLLIESLDQVGLKGYEDEYCAKLSAGQKTPCYPSWIVCIECQNLVIG